MRSLFRKSKGVGRNVGLGVAVGKSLPRGASFFPSSAVGLKTKELVVLMFMVGGIAIGIMVELFAHIFIRAHTTDGELFGTIYIVS